MLLDYERPKEELDKFRTYVELNELPKVVLLYLSIKLLQPHLP